MTTATDYTGIALLLTSGATVLGVLTTSALQVVALLRSAKGNQKLDELHTMVDGQGTKLNNAIGQAAFAQGKADGIAAEQENPTVTESSRGK
jgi:hypothetical protein